MTDASTSHRSLAADLTLLRHVEDLLDISKEDAYGSRIVGEIQEMGLEKRTCVTSQTRVLVGQPVACALDSLKRNLLVSSKA
jgi:hypothetical protein